MDVLARLTEMSRTLELAITDAGPDRINVQTPTGSLCFHADKTGIVVRVQAEIEANAFMLRETAVWQIEQIDGALVTALRWDIPDKVGSQPPNFRVAKVLSVETLGPLFLRLTLAAPDLAPFACDGMHLRLALPQRGRSPVWPCVDATGRVRWPEREDLHIAVYTIRDIDPVAGWMVVDVFRHDDGPTCTWLSVAQPDDAIGIIGPGGGWLPSAPHLTLAGDETAVPAIARILQTADPATTGLAVVELDAAADCPTFDAPRGIEIRILSRTAGEQLEQVLDDVALGQPAARFVWFAAERERAAKMRKYFKETRGVASPELYAKAYWSRSG